MQELLHMDDYVGIIYYVFPVVVFNSLTEAVLPYLS